MSMKSTSPIDIETRPGCIQSALNIVGDKWTPLLLRDLHTAPQTFSDLESSLQLSPRTLSQRLTKLEAEGIIAKRLYCQHPPRYEYHLTDKGMELLTIIRAMAEWGERHSLASRPNHS